MRAIPRNLWLRGIAPAHFPARHRAQHAVRTYTAKPESLSFCQELVQRSDVESFLCLPFVPAGARLSVLAVRAFNVSARSVHYYAKLLSLLQSPSLLDHLIYLIYFINILIMQDILCTRI